MSSLRDSISVIYLPSVIFAVCPIMHRPTILLLCSKQPLNYCNETLIVFSVAVTHLMIGFFDIRDWVPHLTSMSFKRAPIHFIFVIIKLSLSTVNMLVIVVNLCRRENFRQTLKCLEECDGMLMSLGITVDFKREKRSLTLLVIPCMTIVLLYVTAASFSYQTLNARISLILFIRFFFKYVYSGLFSVYGIVIQSVIYWRFLAVNRALRMNCIYKDCDQQTEDQHNKRVKYILTLSQIHCKLGDAYSSHSMSLAVQLLAYFGPYILNIIYVCYVSYCVILDTETISLNVDAEILYVSYSTMFYFLLVHAETRTTEQVHCLVITSLICG